MAPSTNPDEIEASRLERLKDIKALDGSLGDALHKTAVLMKAIDEHLAGHPAIATDPYLYRFTYKAFESLFSLHEAIEIELVRQEH